MCKKKRVFFKKKLFGSIFLTLIKKDLHHIIDIN